MTYLIKISRETETETSDLMPCLFPLTSHAKEYCLLWNHSLAIFSPGKYVPPDEYMTVDGATLTPEDLMSLGKGLYKIRVSTLE